MLLELNFKQKNATFLGVVMYGLISLLVLYNNPILLALHLVFLCYLLTGDRIKYVYANVVTLPRNACAAALFITFNIKLAIWEYKKLNVAKLYKRTAIRYPTKTAFVMDDVRVTFQDGEDLSNKLGSYFKMKNFKRGDTVALLCETRPEYPFLWLGLSKIGIVTALINHNLRKETLLHSIKVVNSKAIIVGAELIDALNDIKNDDGIKNIPVFQFTDEKQRDDPKLPTYNGSIDLLEELKEHKTTDLNEEINKTQPRDKLVYIYTSGTTGMPKAAVITNLRYMFMTTGFTHMIRVTARDNIYNPLPLYHTAGGVLGVGAVLCVGSSMTVRRKFSASNYWTDCIKYNCNIAQYIGELCRYLLAVPPKPTDTKHNIEVILGNGLRPQIWKQFVGRFNIPRVAEFYGSTEGNSNLLNLDNHVGAVGFCPNFAKPFYPLSLIKCDEGSGEPIRNSKGRCIQCRPGEAGVFIGRINPRVAVSAFNGYADEKASEKKIIRDVFTKGDMYFNSGDILVQDILGYFYFKDRTGDTFRWRGENVATSEVEAVISNVAGLHDCVVYGVEIPHVEGRAGMAAIVDADNQLNIEELSAGIKGSLPPYARPIFIRILPELSMTGTFKLKKRDLQTEGYNLHKIKDKLFFLHNDGIYKEFTQKDFDDVQNGRARL
ncbi:long-chain fatty acid transport protein 4 [Condylostylus longicornis]|uniref:long-chain fatty acid transport protein 4 n=1 Tax=Condylostylus longicornis TaxID=2530218 RepID=UPI00244DB876|nr:long-chain fatty acid transport protein 4 [Condylostylus longicornis]XP_055385818.1 long-chain fatty acid transport protein 4 [Condylostylus longicornis]XP_055385819.1 long-chain fatty acid transport protein 4 [Condylostylus longicornis]XP_055385820.1 long-chain fatty acid transport protein 4 [Condylostylus longicornis]